jgi:hypothetical protein
VAIIEALRLIAARSGSLQHKALHALRLTGAAQQMRYNVVAEHALTDPGATFTPEERDALIALMDWPESGSRTERVYLRLTPAEKAQLQADADAETDGNLSELARRRALGR